MGALILQMLASLTVVLALMAAIAFVVNRYLGLRAPVRNSPVAIDVLAQRTLQPKQSLFVVRVGRTMLLIGSSEQGLQMFTELHDEELQRQVEAQQQTPQDPGRIVLNAGDLMRRLRENGPVFLKRTTAQQ
ncbi:MAG: flagellar biosynthetic protein FliO [Bacteroidetes bacterium]|nr:flagellar biosynthetic protein FliO [Bacteroidota bacterium]